ncbi:MAG: VOC family protein, partial [Saprospiraceae bacterium]
TLMFVGEQHGRAEEALNLYSSIFKNAKTDGIMRYGEGLPAEASAEAGDFGGAAGTVQHAQFSLDGQKFMVMDNNGERHFQFNEAVSFVIRCDTQEEIDYFWNALTADGGQESQCAWLKDKFGVSWQVVPPILMKYLSDPNPAKADNVMQAMLKMSKIVIADLERAYEQE